MTTGLLGLGKLMSTYMSVGSDLVMSGYTAPDGVDTIITNDN